MALLSLGRANGVQPCGRAHAPSRHRLLVDDAAKYQNWAADKAAEGSVGLLLALAVTRPSALTQRRGKTAAARMLDLFFQSCGRELHAFSWKGMKGQSPAEGTALKLYKVLSSLLYQEGCHTPRVGLRELWKDVKGWLELNK